MRRICSCCMLLMLIAFTVPDKLLATGGPLVNFPVNDFGIGPSIAYVTGDDSFAANLDISYSIFLFTASTNFKYISIEENRYYGPQFEFSVWLLLNLGGGAGYLWGDKEGRVYHFFAGLPVGDDSPFGWFSIDGSVYIEPFYRANFFRGDVYHEFGLMCKFNTFVF